MPSSRRVPRRTSSHVLALALVVTGIASAPKARADTYYWGGGWSKNWSEYWNGSNGLVEEPDWFVWNRLLFGTKANGTPEHDDDGYTYNDVEDRINVEAMYFYNQAWVCEGKSLLFPLGNDISNNTIGLTASCPSLRLTNDIELGGAAGGGIIRPNLSLQVDAASSYMTVTGQIRGYGALTKSGYGTVELNRFHNYTDGTNVIAGTLIDHYTHGNYRNEATLDFRIDDFQTMTGAIRGGGTLIKSGYGTLTLTDGIKDYSGPTIVKDGTLVVDSPSATSSYRIEDKGRLEFKIAGNRTYVNPVTTEGRGNVYKTGAGTLTLTNMNNRIVDLVIDEGRVIEIDPTGNGDRWVRGGSLQFNTTYDQVFTGRIVSSGSFTKAGAGTLTLAGNDTYTGGTIVSEGRLIDLKPEHQYELSTATSALEFSTRGDSSYTGVISGSGSFTKSGDGTLTLTRVNAYTGGTTVNAGRLIERAPHGRYVTNADLEFALASDFSDNGAVSISGSGSFTKSGTGAYFMSSSNGYSGATVVSAGTLVGMADNVLPTTTALTVNAGAAYKMSPGSLQNVRSLSGAGDVRIDGPLAVSGAASTTFSGNMGGAGSLYKGGGGTLTLSGENTYTGGTTIGSGRLVVANPHGDYMNNAALEFRTANDKTYDGRVSGAGSLTKSGAGTLTLTRRTVYSGGTSVKEGTLELATDAGLLSGSYVELASGATLDLRGVSQALGTLKGDGSVNLRNGGRLFLQGSDSDFVGTIIGGGSFAKYGPGTLTLGGANTYTGGTRVLDSGTLRVTGAVRGDLEVEPNATFENASSGGLVLGAANLRGTVRTSELTRFTGPVVGEGNFEGSGTVRFDGGYAPGDAAGTSLASVTFRCDLVLGASNTLAMDLGGTALGTGYDHLTGLDNATLGGVLNVGTIGGFTVSAGQSFDLFDFRRTSGTFSSVNLPTLSSGLAWDTSALYTSGTIRAQAVPEPATLAALGVGALALLRRRRKHG